MDIKCECGHNGFYRVTPDGVRIPGSPKEVDVYYYEYCVKCGALTMWNPITKEIERIKSQATERHILLYQAENQDKM